MKKRRCPYCGRRISYGAAFGARRKAEYVCKKCGKESKVSVNKKVILIFAVAAVIALAVMAAWIFGELTDNPLGILLVALPLVIFTLITPVFVNFEPYKKYKKSMEAKKAGIAYTDNLLTSELEENGDYSFSPRARRISKPKKDDLFFSFDNEHANTSENAGEGFSINSSIFNKIKAERNASRQRLASDDISSSSEGDERKNYDVPIIDSVSENHASTGASLKKIHSETPPKVTRERFGHYVDSSGHAVEKYNNDGNRYSANRRF